MTAQRYPKFVITICSGNSPTAHIPKTNSVLQLRPVTEGQVLKLLHKLINGKATGVHNIPNRVLKESADIIGPSLTFIFNFSIMSRAFPDDLKMAKVTPAFKGGDRDDLGNYRPISPMIVDNSLTCIWEYHIDFITLKINRGIGIIRRVRQLIPEKALLLLYQILTDLYFRYCSIVWGQCGETLKDK